MRNFMIKMSLAALVVAVSAPVAMAAPSGTSGVSGSAGLGIDVGANIAASGSGDPYLSVPPGGQADGTLGGPVAGLIDKFSKKEDDK
ncbi:hypothetical protein [Solimonas terrae]|uniref:Uncharacterized protein n=1 Tax=Solimonas terrae TaxID=1396819 RepID=A0A6M2BMH5_9GAMM|nr:hypothetical protein [Solimonas terrae]NGY03604.1 hypothetical protein [Solimonas terrae]